MDMDTQKMVSAMKITYLDAEMSVEKTMVALIFEINSSGIYMAMIMINQDTTVLLQIVILGSEIQCLGTVIFLLVLCLVNVITKEQ